MQIAESPRNQKLFLSMCKTNKNAVNVVRLSSTNTTSYSLNLRNQINNNTRISPSWTMFTKNWSHECGKYVEQYLAGTVSPPYTVHFAYFSLSVQYLARLSTWLQWIFFKNLSHNCIPFLLKLALQNNHKHLYCLNEHSLKSNTAAALSDVYVCTLFTTIGKLWG